MNEYKYLVGALGQIELFDHAESEKEAQQLAEGLARPGEFVGIWELKRVGHKESFAWSTPGKTKAETPNRVPSGGLFDNRNKKWSDKDCQLLKQYVASGMSNKEIARELGRTPRAVELKKWSLQIDVA